LQTFEPPTAEPPTAEPPTAEPPTTEPTVEPAPTGEVLPTPEPLPTDTPSPTDTPLPTDTPTATPPSDPYNGLWVGTLSGKTAGDIDFNGTFQMEVRGSTIYSFAIDGPTCPFETFPNSPIAGNAFSINGADDSITFSAAGAFSSSAQASGSLNASQNGESCAIATWTATKQ
jgi:hypothetical protein